MANPTKLKKKNTKAQAEVDKTNVDYSTSNSSRTKKLKGYAMSQESSGAKKLRKTVANTARLTQLEKNKATRAKKMQNL